MTAVIIGAMLAAFYLVTLTLITRNELRRPLFARRRNRPALIIVITKGAR